MIARRHWWKVLLAIFVIGGAGVLFMGVQTYQEAPPIVDFVAPSGEIVVPADSIHAGKAVFQKYALMQYGTMFGDGGARGPDFTAESLHETVVSMTAFHEAAFTRDHAKLDDAAKAGIADRVKREIRENRHDPRRGVIPLVESQVAAWEALVRFTADRFRGSGRESFKPAGYITDDVELRNLASFFFWGAWVCGAERPGTGASYTQNWPFDPMAGNTATPGTVFWSVIGSLGLIFALGIVLFFYGRTSGIASWQPSGDMEAAATAASVESFVPTPTQRATYKFFAVAAALFFLQVLAGILTIHDFVGFTRIFGIDLQKALPLPITRSWHVQISVLWISTCWIAASIFLLPKISGQEPPGQVRFVNLLFVMLATVVGGTVVGCFLGPKGFLGDWWLALGNQGWEFVELGKVWQGLLFAALIVWAFIVWRGVRSALRPLNPFSLPHWILYSVVAIVILFTSSFVAGPRTNFVVADFWRWMVIHMWAECFFEVFTTVIIAYFMVMMGLVAREGATRIVYFATLLFLGSGLLGISHNFYWNAKPEMTLAIGSIFSTLQVVPLVLLTIEAWRFRQLPETAMRQSGGVRPAFGQAEAFLFLIAVNFWNFFGAGVFGFIINLPIVNYYEHGTYLTVNHGHAALMGVYGNLSIAAILFCSRYLIRGERWNAGLLRTAFWSMNVGLMLMVLLDLFPAGLWQLKAVLDHGLWSARSAEFIQGAPFQTMTWMRIIGGALFMLGGVVPLAGFMLAGFRHLKAATGVLPVEPTGTCANPPLKETGKGQLPA